MRKPSHVVPGSPALLTKSEKEKLEAQWEKNPLAQRLLKKYEADPLILHAIHEVRDTYFQLFSEKRYLLKEQKKHPNDPEIQAQIEDINFDMVLLNNKSFLRFTYPGHGVSVATQKELYHGGDRPPHIGDPLDKATARKIVGPIIGASIDCFEGLNKFYQFRKTPRMQVPGQASLLATPASLNMTRSQSRKQWVSDVEAGQDAPDSPRRR